LHIYGSTHLSWPEPPLTPVKVSFSPHDLVKAVFVLANVAASGAFGAVPPAFSAAYFQDVPAFV
jgi:hypothetical protein